MTDHSSNHEEAESTQYTILVADSDKDRRKTIHVLLTSSTEYLVKEVSSEESLLSSLAADTVHLVILNEKLGGEDLLSLVRKLKATQKKLPVIVTADFRSKLGHEIFSAGVDDCIFLPLRKEEFLFRITRSIRFYHLLTLQETLVRENEELWDRAITDRLTGLYNRQYFEEVFQGEFERTRRYRGQLGCIIFDIDLFKNVNDDYGHLVGDVVLREIGKLVRITLRRVDIAARFGGEEFVIIMPETSREGLLLVGERVRGLVQDHKFCKDVKELKKPMRQVTISLGAAHYPDEEIRDAMTMLKFADESLYRAKRHGRNRLEVAWEYAYQ